MSGVKWRLTVGRRSADHAIRTKTLKPQCRTQKNMDGEFKRATVMLGRKYGAHMLTGVDVVCLYGQHQRMEPITLGI